MFITDDTDGNNDVIVDNNNGEFVNFHFFFLNFHFLMSTLTSLPTF